MSTRQAMVTGAGAGARTAEARPGGRAQEPAGLRREVAARHRARRLQAAQRGPGAAAVTRTIKLATGITLVTERNPLILAKQMVLSQSCFFESLGVCKSLNS